VSGGFNPSDLAAWTGGHWTQPPSGTLRGFHFDSRRLGPGSVFVALAGAQRDGHDFLPAAAAAGAAAALVSRPRPEAGLA
jgi:UDP-N-acetylmuramyl pentapeptide synthase